jgi:hypothetical protein
LILSHHDLSINQYEKTKMLELEIKDLKEEVKNLSALMAELIGTLRNDDITTAKRAEVAKAAEVAPVTKAKEPKQPVKEEPKVATVTREDVQSVCTTLMRKDRGLKNTIKEMIEGFGGATNLVKVAESDLEALHVELSKLL